MAGLRPVPRLANMVLDGLGMAESTPGPLIMVVQFVGFLGAYRNPGVLDPCCRRRHRLAGRDLGDLRAVPPFGKHGVDIFGRAPCREKCPRNCATIAP